MTNCFNVVTVWIKNKYAVVIGVVMRAQTGWAVVQTTSFGSSRVESIYQWARSNTKSNMNPWFVWRAFAHPEIRLGWLAKTRDVGMTSDGSWNVCKQAVTNGR